MIFLDFVRCRANFICEKEPEHVSATPAPTPPPPPPPKPTPRTLPPRKYPPPTPRPPTPPPPTPPPPTPSPPTPPSYTDGSLIFNMPCVAKDTIFVESSFPFPVALHQCQFFCQSISHCKVKASLKSFLKSATLGSNVSYTYNKGQKSKRCSCT